MCTCGKVVQLSTCAHAQFLSCRVTGAILALRPLQNDLHGLVVLPLDLEVGHAAVPLGRGDLAVAEKVLDGGEAGVGIQELGCEGMPVIPSSE